MVSSSAGNATTHAGVQPVGRKKESLALRRIWLPKLLYDALPYFYLTSGLTAFFATLYITEWFWILPHYVLFSLACLHIGVAVLRRRRGNRNTEQSG